MSQFIQASGDGQRKEFARLPLSSAVTIPVTDGPLTFSWFAGTAPFPQDIAREIWGDGTAKKP